MILHYQKPNLLSKLHDELLVAGITLERVEGLDSDIWLIVSDDTPQATIDQIAAIVEAHDPTPPAPPLEALIIAADKTQITANGTDTATITITLQPAGTGISVVDVLVDGPPVVEEEVVGDTATFLFRATSPGKYMIEGICGNIRNHIFVKAV